MINIRKLETELWEAADLLRVDSKVTSQEYCMPVLGLIFLRIKAGISTGALAKLGKNENVNTEILAKICKVLDCGVDDVMEFIPDDKN